MENDASTEQPLAVSQSIVGPATVLAPAGSLTFENCGHLEAAFKGVVDAGKREVVIDCKSVGVMDSCALELLTRMHQIMEASGGALKLVGLNEVCRDIAIVTRLCNLLHLHDDLNDAIRTR